MRYLVLGSGMQGRACAFDLLKNPATTEVVLADSSEKNLALARKSLKSKKARTIRVDVSNASQVRKLAKGRDVMVSAVPYFFNLELAKIAIAAKTHYVD